MRKAKSFPSPVGPLGGADPLPDINRTLKPRILSQWIAWYDITDWEL